MVSAFTAVLAHETMDVRSRDLCSGSVQLCAFFMAFDLQNAMAKASFFNTIGRKNMADENDTGSNLIWAIATIIIVAIIAGAVYYSGFLGGTKKQNIDVEIKAPATSR
jgi:hypothetical protein